MNNIHNLVGFCDDFILPSNLTIKRASILTTDEYGAPNWFQIVASDNTYYIVSRDKMEELYPEALV